MLFVYKILYFICSIFKFLTKFSTLLLLLFLHTFSHTNIKTFQCAWTHTADQNHWLILFYFIGRGAEGGLGTLSNSCTYIFHTVIAGEKIAGPRMRHCINLPSDGITLWLSMNEVQNLFTILRSERVTNISDDICLSLYDIHTVQKSIYLTK